MSPKSEYKEEEGTRKTGSLASRSPCIHHPKEDASSPDASAGQGIGGGELGRRAGLALK